MSNWPEQYNETTDIPDLTDIMEDPESGADSESPARESILGTQAAQAGMQTQSLQSAINNWAEALNQAAIGRNGLPVKTPTPQYKGFAAEEFHKLTLKINSLANGIPDFSFESYSSGPLPDGFLSKTDMHSDVVAYYRKWPWQKPKRVADAQLKMHSGKNADKAYAKDMAKEQYANQEFVGDPNRGINGQIHAKAGKKEITSDSITSEAAEALAENMKKQSSPEYEHSEEKFKQLNRVNLLQAVKAGAISGAIISTASEICYVIKNRNALDEDQFIQSIQKILCGTVDGGIRGGAIMGSVQLMEKALGRRIPTNTFEAVPVMAAANISIDFAKDLYRCFISKTIDKDDLLSNTVNNTFSSFAGMTGAWAGGQIAGQIVAHAATGFTIGSALGPVGSIVGAAIGGLLFGLGANTVIKAGTKDAEKAFRECIESIDAQLELEGIEKKYFFANAMAEISEFRLSFKNLLPCYNLISDLKEYNLHKKAIRRLHEQLNSDFTNLDENQRKALQQLEEIHQKRLERLEAWLTEQRKTIYGEYREGLKAYISSSYMQYIELNTMLTDDIEKLMETLEANTTQHSIILDYVKNRNAVNAELNIILEDLMTGNDTDIIRPFAEQITQFMQRDELLIGKQYISFYEALRMISGVA